jgi:diguanylate cyclase (GGDEF)-like protein
MCVEEDVSLDEVSRQITADRDQELAQVFVVTRGGQFVGMGRTRTLLQRITDRQMLMARHSNPLTLLPGNVPIHEHVERRLAEGGAFRLAYFDLNNFKPFNDVFGFKRGDEVIQLVAQTLKEHTDADLDFVGHVGGDDFLVAFGSEDWRERCERALADFARNVQRFYPAESLRAGGIYCENRQGQRDFFGLLAVAVGVVDTATALPRSPDELISFATAAKREAKKLGGNAIHVDAGAARKKSA